MGVIRKTFQLQGRKRKSDIACLIDIGAPTSFVRPDVVQRLGPDHVASLERALGPALGSAALPKRVAVFGLATLPPLYARVLTSVARQADVHVLSLSPSRSLDEIIGDVADDLRRSAGERSAAT